MWQCVTFISLQLLRLWLSSSSISNYAHPSIHLSTLWPRVRWFMTLRLTSSALLSLRPYITTSPLGGVNQQQNSPFRWRPKPTPKISWSQNLAWKKNGATQPPFQPSIKFNSPNCSKNVGVWTGSSQLHFNIPNPKKKHGFHGFPRLSVCYQLPIKKDYTLVK